MVTRATLAIPLLLEPNIAALSYGTKWRVTFLHVGIT